LKDRLNQPDHLSEKFLLFRKQLQRSSVNDHFERGTIYADLEWVVEIPDLDNIVVDAGDTLDQCVSLKEGTCS